MTSDHGWDVMRPADHPLRGLETPAGPLDGIAADATPLLLVKPAGARGPLRTSDAPTTIPDVPATLLDLADLPADGRFHAQLDGDADLQAVERCRRDLGAVAQLSA